MSETSTETTAGGETQTSETTAPEKKSLADLLDSLDDDAKTAVLGEVEKARKEAKGLRDRLKAAEPAATELAALKASQQTAEQRAAAEAQALRDEATQAMQRAAGITVRAALTGVVDDPDAIIEDLNLARFLGDDGQIDESAITALRDKYAALGGGTRRPRPDPSQASGANGKTASEPRDEFASILQRELRGAGKQ